MRSISLSIESRAPRHHEKKAGHRRCYSVNIFPFCSTFSLAQGELVPWFAGERDWKISRIKGDLGTGNVRENVFLALPFLVGFPYLKVNFSTAHRNGETGSGEGTTFFSSPAPQGEHDKLLFR